MKTSPKDVELDERTYSNGVGILVLYHFFFCTLLSCEIKFFKVNKVLELTNINRFTLLWLLHMA